MNALDLQMVELFLSKLNNWQKDNSIKRVLLKGEGKAFCAGGVESVLISKTYNPTWYPRSIHDIDIHELKKLFQTHTEKLGL